MMMVSLPGHHTLCFVKNTFNSPSYCKTYKILLTHSTSLKYNTLLTSSWNTVQYWSKGLQHYTRVKPVYYTHITCSVHAVSSSAHRVSTHLTCKYRKMRVITWMLLHAVDVILRIKLHAVIQLELINCV